MEGASHYFMLLDFEYPKNQLCRNYCKTSYLDIANNHVLPLKNTFFLRAVYIIEIYCNDINVGFMYLTQLHVNA